MLIPILLVLITAASGTYITNAGLNSLAYQDWSFGLPHPPAFVFSVVWSAIYASYAYTWATAVKGSLGNIAFGLNMFLNALWVWLFFGQKQNSMWNLWASRLIIALLTLLTFAQIYFVRSSPVGIGSLLLYGGWLLVASSLNFTTNIRRK